MSYELPPRFDTENVGGGGGGGKDGLLHLPKSFNPCQPAWFAQADMR